MTKKPTTWVGVVRHQMHKNEFASKTDITQDSFREMMQKGQLVDIVYEHEEPYKIKVGTVTKWVIDKEGTAHISFELDTSTKLGAYLEDAIQKGILRGLSIGHFAITDSSTGQVLQLDGDHIALCIIPAGDYTWIYTSMNDTQTTPAPPQAENVQQQQQQRPQETIAEAGHQRCSRCGGLGHKVTTCTSPPQEVNSFAPPPAEKPPELATKKQKTGDETSKEFAAQWAEIEKSLPDHLKAVLANPNIDENTKNALLEQHLSFSERDKRLREIEEKERQEQELREIDSVAKHIERSLFQLPNAALPAQKNEIAVLASKAVREKITASRLTFETDKLVEAWKKQKETIVPSLTPAFGTSGFQKILQESQEKTNGYPANPVSSQAPQPLSSSSSSYSSSSFLPHKSVMNRVRAYNTSMNSTTDTPTSGVSSSSSSTPSSSAPMETEKSSTEEGVFWWKKPDGSVTKIEGIKVNNSRTIYNKNMQPETKFLAYDTAGQVACLVKAAREYPSYRHTYGPIRKDAFEMGELVESSK